MAYDTPMAKSIRQQIVEYIIDKLKLISKTNGYSQDYATISEWKLSALAKLDLPAILLIDDSQDVTGYHENSMTDFTLHLVLSVFVKDNVSLNEQTGTKVYETPELLRNYIADVYKCLGSDITCGGLAFDIQPQGDNMNLIQKNSVYGDIDLKFDVIYSTKSWDLYTQV